MKQQILLITPPFTQLNAPYPATAYLKGFLNTRNIQACQADLGIEVILSLFSSKGLTALFDKIIKNKPRLSDNTERIVNLRNDYIKSIDNVISFLQGNNPVLANLICDDSYLPEAFRFSQLGDMEWAFGAMGISDKAKHLATLYLEDLSDLITEAIDPDFGFSRYAERLGRSAATFDTLHDKLNEPNSLIDDILIELFEVKIKLFKPTAVALSVPFPGNLYSALKCGQHLKSNHPEIKIIMGGGYVNTELRSLKETRVFDYVDYITLDDGEAPLLNIIEHLNDLHDINNLKRTFALSNGKVQFFDNSEIKDFTQNDSGTPDYSDLPLDKYISVIETVNPMHRLWSDGRWNKLTLAHGCYWGKCTFCDTSLDYIKRYEPNSAVLLCDRMETIIKQTGQCGFHFVDEAAPPALLKDLALEILKRKLTVAWWTNIRFEKSFTLDLCRLLKESGCIAVAGGLEVASDRLLQLINKGVTVSQVAKVADNFTQSGIMVHAYLMYGFPTQTAQETIDSLEIVRQLFMNGIVQSGFWHHFAMTVHSEVGRNPGKFNVTTDSPTDNPFANNEITCIDKKGCRHKDFAEGLRKALFNYMHGIGFDMPLDDWFNFDVPHTCLSPDFIELVLSSDNETPDKNKRLIWLGSTPALRTHEKNKKGKEISVTELIIDNKKSCASINITLPIGEYLCELLQKLSPSNSLTFTLADLEADFIKHNLGDFNKFLRSQAFSELQTTGLLHI